MSFSATRLTLYAILSSIENDLRNIITAELESHVDVETVIGDVWPGAKDRFIKEVGVFGRKPSLKEILYYVDFGDLYMILNRHKTEISLSAQNYIKANTKKFEDLVPIRNRVAHSRPLLFEDFPKVWDVAEDLIANFPDFSKEVGYILQRIQADPSYVLSVTLPEQNNDKTIANNLPTPDFDETGFIGRSEVVTQVLNFCKKGAYPVITIVGEGGLGKTALALKVAYDLLDDPNNPFEAIVWASAKTRQLTASTVKDIDNAIRDSLSMFSSISTELTGANANEPIEEIMNYLTEFKILLILDNLETVIDARVNNFMANIPSGTKVLITSRIGLGAYETPVKLDPLEIKDSIQLIRTLARVRGVSSLSKIPNNQLAKYCQKMKNNPAYVKWFVSGVQAGQRPEDVLDHPETFLEFCMSNVYKYLTGTSKMVLKSMQAVPGRHSQAELGFLCSNLESIELQRALQQLITTNMVIMSSVERGSSYETTYDISELARSYLELSYPLDTYEVLTFTKRKRQLVSAGESFESNRQRNPYSVKTIVTRSRRDFVVAKNLYETIKQILSKKDLEIAKRGLEETRRLAPDYYEVHRVEAHLHSLLGNYPAARSSYETAIELEPNSAPLHYWYGIFLMRSLNDTEAALAQFEKARKIDPVSYQIKIELVRANLYLYNFDEAFSLDQDLLAQMEIPEGDRRKIYDLHLQCYVRYAEHLEKGHSNIEAVECLSKLIEEYRNCPEYLKDEQMIDHVRKAAGTARRCAYFLDKHPDQRETANDMYEWLIEL